MRLKAYFTMVVCPLALGLSSSALAQAFTPTVASTISSDRAAIGTLSASRQSFSPASSTAAAPLPRVFTPTLPRATYTRYPWKTDIVATVFWVGELPTENNPTPNTASSWDVNWTTNFGGFDDPDPSRRAPDYRPAAFVPQLNPFYVALPYNDCQDYRTTKTEAYSMIPWFKQTFKKAGKSVCRDRWVAIRMGDRICYAQWSDCGPFVTDDAAYVFGTARPQNTKNDGAGIDVSPAVRDYLSFSGRSKCDWRFVDVHEVPDGPWKVYGDNNHFVQQATQNKDVVASRLEELRRARDEWFRTNGSSDMRRR